MSLKPFEKILVPIDFSLHADEAILAAGDLSRRYEAAVVLVNVYTPVAYTLPEGYLLYTPNQLAELLTQLAKELSAAKTKAELAGALRVETRQLQGVPAWEIVEFARTGNFDLIVMSTHGRTGIGHALMGSVAEKVVRTAPCAVLTIKAHASPA